MTNIERRAMLPAHVELRAQSENDRPVLTGYAIRFNSLSVPMDEGDGEFRELILPEAVAETLDSGPDVVALAHHDHRLVLGRRSVGTLKLVADDLGVRTLIFPPDNTLGRDIVESVRRGDLASMSFGFEVLDDEFEKAEDDTVVRTLKKIRLHETSIVAWPAYPETSIKVRDDVPGKVRAMRAGERSEPVVAQVPMSVLVRRQQHAQRASSIHLEGDWLDEMLSELSKKVAEEKS